MPARRNATTPERIKISEYERQGLELRTARATYKQIAETVRDSKGKPVWASEGAACNAIKRALKATVQEAADELRALEARSLDALEKALWPEAIRGGNNGRLAIDRIMVIKKRRAELFGLDAPLRRIMEVVTEDDFQRVCERLEAQLAENDDAAAEQSA